MAPLQPVIITDTFNPQVFRAVLAARHLTMRTVSERIGVTERDLRHEIDAGPSQKTINELSTQLAVPSFVFYMDHAPRLSDAIVDFRSTTPSRQGKSRQTIEAIDMAQRLQEVAEEDLEYADHLKGGTSPKALSHWLAASAARQSLRISPQLQTAAKDEREFMRSVARQSSYQAYLFCTTASPPKMVAAFALRTLVRG